MGRKIFMSGLIIIVTGQLFGFGYTEVKEKLPLAQELFPNSDLIWGKKFKGKMVSCEIAEKSGHVVIGVIQDWVGYVYLFAPDGKLLWEKNSKEHSEIEQCVLIKLLISDIGNTINIEWNDYENGETQIYDISGKNLHTFHHKLGRGISKILPNGEYLIYGKDIIDKTGKKMILKNILSREKNIEIFDYRSDKMIVLLDNFENVFYIYSFPDGKMKWKSEKLKLESQKIVNTYNGKYISVSGENALYLYFFRLRKGGLMWGKRFNEKLGSHVIEIDEDNKYIAIYGWEGKVVILSLRTGEIRLSTSELKKHFSSPNMICLKNKVMVSGQVGEYIKDLDSEYWTYVFSFDVNLNITDELWRKGLIIGSSSSRITGIYERNGTNEDFFTINILRRRGELNLYQKRFGKDWKSPLFPTGPKDQLRFAKEWVPYTDCIVIGKVKKIENHPEGPYQTWITIEVEKYLKGELEKKEVLVKILSGKTLIITTEPIFALNEKILVFLTTIPYSLHSFYEDLADEVMSGQISVHPCPRYKNITKCIGYFEPMSNNLKFEIVGDEVRVGRNHFTAERILVTEGVKIGNLDDFVREISSVVGKETPNKRKEE